MNKYRFVITWNPTPDSTCQAETIAEVRHSWREIDDPELTLSEDERVTDMAREMSMYGVACKSAVKGAKLFIPASRIACIEFIPVREHGGMKLDALSRSGWVGEEGVEK